MFPPHGRARWRSLAAAAALVALVVAAYAPALRAGFVWDDDMYVSQNPVLTSTAGLSNIWLAPRSTPQYYPLVYTSFWLEYRLWGLQPLGYHATNIALQAICGLLLWRLLLRLQVPGAWLAAAIFAVHPVQVESVAWVTERKNVLSMVFALSAVLAYLRFAPPEEAIVPRRGARMWRSYAAALILFVLALLSKTAVTPLPGALLVIAWWKRGRLSWHDVWPVLPMFALSVAGGAMTMWVEANLVQAVGPIYELSPWARILVAGRALWFYAGKLIWPYPIITFYPRWNVDGHVWWQWLFPLAAAGVVVGLWLARRSIGRGPLAAVLIYAGMLVPALGFFKIYFTRYSFVADHFQYHACGALIALAVATACLAAARLKEATDRPWWPAVEKAAAAGVLLALVALSFRQSLVYHDIETYYRDTIAKNPGGRTAYVNLSAELANKHRYQEAVDMARQAIRLSPEDPKIYHRLGALLSTQGEHEGFTPERLAEGMAALRTALQLDPRDINARGQLGVVLQWANRFDEALQQFEQIIKDDPNNAAALFGAGVTLARLGQPDQALAYLQRSVTAEPEFAKAWYSMGVLQIGAGRMEDGISSLRRALQLQPKMAEAHYDLGNALAAQNQLAEAIEQYNAAMRDRPAYLDAMMARGATLVLAGDLPRAIAQFEAVLRLDPNNVTAMQKLTAARKQERESQHSKTLDHRDRQSPPSGTGPDAGQPNPP